MSILGDLIAYSHSKGAGNRVFRHRSTFERNPMSGDQQIRSPYYEELFEQFASTQHDIWAHWMKYQLSKCERKTDGSLVIPPDLVHRWEDQMNADFDELSEEEKDSDRDIVTKFMSYLVNKTAYNHERV